MKVILNHELATITLLPVETKEFVTLINLLGALKPGDKLCYGGRKDEGEFCAIILRAGGHDEPKIEKHGSITHHFRKCVGGIEFVLRGSTEDDKHAVGYLRDVCYYGSNGFIFLTDRTAEGERALVMTATHCQHCGAQMIDRGRCEWKTCAACADKCDHTYKRGLCHGGSAEMAGMGEFCTKCGCGKLNVKPELPLIRHGESKMVRVDNLY